MNTPNETPAKRGRKPKQPIATDDHTADADASPVKSNIPPCPEGNPDQGMKSPEVVEWWFTYHPEQAKAKYGGLTFPEAPF
jgi:hypothetical protein